MDKCTHEVRLQNWKNIIKQCHSRPEGQTAKQWLKEHGVCEQTYYVWQRKIRRETYDQMKVSNDLLPAVSENASVSFAEIPIPIGHNDQASHSSLENSINPVAVLKNKTLSIAITNNISEELLKIILKEVDHA